MLVAAFAVVSVLRWCCSARPILGAGGVLRRLPEARQPRPAPAASRNRRGRPERDLAVVVAIGLTLTMLVVVLVLQLNLRNEYLGASVFDAPTLVASDLFDDEVAQLQGMETNGTGDVTLHRHPDAARQPRWR